MSVLIAIIYLVLGAVTGGIIASACGALLFALVSLFKGNFWGLFALIWPALVWFLVLPLIFFGIGMLGDSWGYKFQVFALVSAGLVGLPSLITFCLAAVAAALDVKSKGRE